MPAAIPTVRNLLATVQILPATFRVGPDLRSPARPFARADRVDRLHGAADPGTDVPVDLLHGIRSASR